jgi:hypothetical protein
MNEEIEDDVTELELEDDALEKRMRKLESEAERILRQSTELIREMSKGKEKQEETKQEENQENKPLRVK